MMERRPPGRRIRDGLRFQTSAAHLRPFKRRPIFFLTVCTYQRRQLLANPEAHEALRAIWTEAAASYGWFVGSYVRMPDHLHLFAKAGMEAKALALWGKTWKSLSARFIAASSGCLLPIWQKNYFDRFLRSSESYSQAWNYVCANPQRAGLANHPGEWPYGGAIAELRLRD